jgi:hypothetical protein
MLACNPFSRNSNPMPKSHFTNYMGIAWQPANMLSVLKHQNLFQIAFHIPYKLICGKTEISGQLTFATY